MACANATVHVVEGKTVQEAWGVNAREIVEYLETLPEEEFHCAGLAVRTRRAALTNNRDVEREPWKKLCPRK